MKMYLLIVIICRENQILALFERVVWLVCRMGLRIKTQCFSFLSLSCSGARETLLVFRKCVPYTPSSSGELSWPAQGAHSQEAHRDPSWGQESLRLAADPQRALKGLGAPGQ